MKIVVDEYDLPRMPSGIEVKKESLTFLDYRTVPTLEEAKKCSLWYKDWFSRGTNHREDKERNMVVCDVPETNFTIDVNSLEELASLVTKMEGMILAKSPYLEAPLQISPEFD